jgi:hypothetical protein
MSEFIPLWEVRTLVTDALQVVNDVDEGTPPEWLAGLQRIRHRLHSALLTGPWTRTRAGRAGRAGLIPSRQLSIRDGAAALVSLYFLLTA